MEVFVPRGVTRHKVIALPAWDEDWFRWRELWTWVWLRKMGKGNKAVNKRRAVTAVFSTSAGLFLCFSTVIFGDLFTLTRVYNDVDNVPYSPAQSTHFDC